jgi:ATP-binding cassette subfamily B protein
MFERNLYVSDIFKVMDTAPYIVRAKRPVCLKLVTAPTVEFRDVWFKYDGREDWILENINLTIQPGEKIALVGENGAGKSTLVKLLARIYDPTKGEIFVNGVNLKKIDPDEWNSCLAVLLQDYLSYDFTLAESIAMGRPDMKVHRNKVENSVQFAGASDFVSSWKNGFDQQIGKEFDGGVEPSKGQNQKIALARTIYREGLVTVLDEPTAAIDALSESRIFEQMEQASNGRTLIVITHRFNTTQTVDRIVVLDKRTIVEQGSHKDLVSAGGLYSKMFEVQAKVFRESEAEEVM